MANLQRKVAYQLALMCERINNETKLPEYRKTEYELSNIANHTAINYVKYANRIIKVVNG